MKDELQYTNRTGTITHIDDAGQIHRTRGGCAVIPDIDKYIRLKIKHLSVAQLVARYLGVMGISKSHQTKIGGSFEPPIFFYFLAKSLEISRFRNKHDGLVLPCFEG